MRSPQALPAREVPLRSACQRSFDRRSCLNFLTYPFAAAATVRAGMHRWGSHAGTAVSRARRQTRCTAARENRPWTTAASSRGRGVGQRLQCRRLRLWTLTRACRQHR